mmetsp:Transcript_13791/g.37269  ORF Transcript_13791/g.37269 Transcript_13791/m.37269 type:complete len:283 (+) Transcript_13791:2172-3020(+)
MRLLNLAKPCVTHATASTRWHASMRTPAVWCWPDRTGSCEMGDGTHGSTTTSSMSWPPAASPSPPRTTCSLPLAGQCLERPRLDLTLQKCAGSAQRARARPFSLLNTVLTARATLLQPAPAPLPPPATTIAIATEEPLPARTEPPLRRVLLPMQQQQLCLQGIFRCPGRAPPSCPGQPMHLPPSPNSHCRHPAQGRLQQQHLPCVPPLLLRLRSAQHGQTQPVWLQRHRRLPTQHLGTRRHQHPPSPPFEGRTLWQMVNDEWWEGSAIGNWLQCEECTHAVT